MVKTGKRTVSDWAVIILGCIGFLLGISGIIDPHSQYDMLRLESASIAQGSVIPVLLSSASLSAMYVGIMYIYGILNNWRGFKAYLVFARSLMCIGFLVLVSLGKAPGVYLSAAIWEGIGAVIILVVLWWDRYKYSRLVQ